MRTFLLTVGLDWHLYFITSIFPAPLGYGSRNLQKEKFYVPDVALSTCNPSFQETGQEHGVFDTYHVYLAI